jgi:hypothetical protein
MPPCTALLDNPAKAGMLRSSRFTAPAAPILGYLACGVRKPLEADLAGEGALRGAGGTCGVLSRRLSQRRRRGDAAARAV